MSDPMSSKSSSSRPHTYDTGFALGTMSSYLLDFSSSSDTGDRESPPAELGGDPFVRPKYAAAGDL